MQNELNVFNEGNIVYQATLQRSLQQAQIWMQDAQKEADLTLQADTQEYTLKLQKYQAELQEYQATIGKIVQFNQAELAAWQGEATLKVQELQAIRTSELQKYTNDISNQLNVFNKENAKYQVSLQAAVESAKIEGTGNAGMIQAYGLEVQSYQAQVNSAIQEWTAGTWNVKFLKYQQDYNAAIQTYAQDIQDEAGRSGSSLQIYAAEVTKVAQNNQAIINRYTADIQEFAGQFQAFGVLIQEKQLHYTWHMQQYTELKNKYNEIFELTQIQQQDEALEAKMEATA
jgi:hypothetical protein